MRLTRQSYKRKIIAFGVASFISLSLIATGFASWVLAGTADKSGEGQVTVGTTTDKAITITDISFENDEKNFIFEPTEEDTTGRVRNDGENFEDLSVTFSCTISPIDFVKEIDITFEYPESIQKAIDDGYILAPVVNVHIEPTNTTDTITGTFKLSGDVDPENPEDTNCWSYTPGADGKATLAVTLSFAWGEKFGGVNPGDYFDDTEGRELYESIDEVRDVLDTFKATMLGRTLEDYRALSEDDVKELENNLKYTVNIHAAA